MSKRLPSRSVLHDTLIGLSQLVENLTDVEARLGRAIARERAGTPARDGWSATVGVDRNGGRSTAGADGVHRPTEKAASRELNKDPHRDLVLDAIHRIYLISQHLTELRDRLDSIDDLTKETVFDPKTCEVCTGKRGKGGDRQVAHRGTVGDRLTHVIDLCNDCYSYVYQSAEPGSRQGEVPADDQIRLHELRGRWNVRNRKRAR